MAGMIAFMPRHRSFNFVNLDVIPIFSIQATDRGERGGGDLSGRTHTLLIDTLYIVMTDANDAKIEKSIPNKPSSTENILNKEPDTMPC